MSETVFAADPTRLLIAVLAIYRWHSLRKRVLKKDPSINKVLREEKEDIEALKYDASMILWYSKI